MTAASKRGAIWLPLASVCLALMVPLTMLLAAGWLFGWRFQPVETESMAPAMPVGSMAVVLPVDPDRIIPGTMIVFVDPQAPGRLVAHRVVEIASEEPLRFETKGDANLTFDPFPVSITDVRGVVGWTIPGLGGVVTTLRGAPAVLLLVILPLTILVVTEIGDHWKRRRQAAQPAG